MDSIMFYRIGSSEAAARDIANQMIDKELEVYVKEWTIEEKKAVTY